MKREAKSYVVIADTLRQKILSGAYLPGDALPSERQLSETFEVSRMTVRHALSLMEIDGLIERRRGRGGGTFVSSRPPLVELTRMEGFLPQLRARGMRVTSEILKSEIAFANSTQALCLEVEPGTGLFNILRLRSVDGKPLLIENSFFPLTLFPHLLETNISESIYEILSALGHPPCSKQERLLVGSARPWEQKILKLAHDQPVLKIFRTAYNKAGIPIEYSEDLLRSDFAQVKVITGKVPHLDA